MLSSIHVDHIGIAARDPGASAAFYRDVLGLVPVPGEGPGVHLGLGGATLVIGARGADEVVGPRGRGEHFAFRVAGGIEETTSALATAGVAFERVRNRLYVQDPDGYVIELVC